MGQAQGNYDEFRFFTRLRPSEQIALLISDCNPVKGTIAITKARVMSRDKDRTKNLEFDDRQESTLGCQAAQGIAHT